MARAKRTDRAEARRKYRAYLQAQEEAAAAEEGESAGSTGAASSASGRGHDQRPAQTPQPGARMSMFGAAKAAYRTPHYVDDVRNIWPLVARSNAIWPVLVLCVASGAYMTWRIGSGNASGDPILAGVYSFVFYPAPLVPAALAGFLAPRSTWLAGLIASFIATMTLVIVVGINVGSFSNTSGTIAVASPTPAGSPSAAASEVGSAGASASPSVLATTSPAATVTPVPTASAAAGASAEASPAASSSTAIDTGTATTSGGNSIGDLLNLAVMLLVQSLGFGAVIGALSGWYKRFLQGYGPSNPPSKSNRGRTPQRRRPATR